MPGMVQKGGWNQPSLHLSSTLLVDPSLSTSVFFHLHGLCCLFLCVLYNTPRREHKEHSAASVWHGRSNTSPRGTSRRICPESLLTYTHTHTHTHTHTQPHTHTGIHTGTYTQKNTQRTRSKWSLTSACTCYVILSNLCLHQLAQHA